MNVFVIPSWYPSHLQPNSGIFVKEQIAALATSQSDIIPIVSLWGHRDYELSLRNVFDIFVKARYHFSRKSRKRGIYQFDGFYEVYYPSFHFFYNFFGLGINILIKRNSKNLELAKNTIGKIDLIHAHVGYPGGYIAMCLSKKYNIPYVITEHMSPFPFDFIAKSKKISNLLKNSFINSRSIIAVSSSLSKAIYQFCNVKAVVVPNIIDEFCFYPKRQDTTKFIFLTVCGLIKQKGIENLLYAISMWRPSSAVVKFVIVGDGPLKNDLFNLADKLEINDLIEWKGHVSHELVPYLYNSSNVFVLPSYHESFGVVLVEALACGLPIISTKCGGPEDIVNSSNGILVEIGDIESLSLALQNMFCNIFKYEKTVILSDFEARFAKNVVVSKIRDVYIKSISIF
jgi:glycosyltransferase involved in cell wall biosynthesis